MVRRHPLAAYFALACGVSWLLWSPLWLPALGVEGLPVVPYHHALGALGPIAAAFLMSAMEAGREGPRDLLVRMIGWRGRLPWIGVALLGPFALLLLAAGVALLVSDASVDLAGFGRSTEFPEFGFIGFLFYNVVTFGYGEEVGWRGYALPRLQTNRSALAATVLLSIGWGLWHVPLFLYRPGYVEMGAAGAAGWFVSLLTGAVLLTWLYNGSRGSLLVVALFHATVDVVFTSDISSDFIVNAAGTLITLWGVAVIIAAGPRYLSRRDKVALMEGRATPGFVERAGQAGGRA